METRCDTICGVVLAGGKSRRMGLDKAFISLAGKPLIEHVTTALTKFFSEVIIVRAETPHLDKHFRRLPFQILQDKAQDLGPIAGIETALEYVSDKGIFVVAADMPFLNPKVIEAMLSFSKEYDLVLPQISGRFHPLHAFYSQHCLPVIQENIQLKNLSLQRLREKLKNHVFSEEVFHHLDPNFRSIININTPEELERAGLIEAN